MVYATDTSYIAMLNVSRVYVTSPFIITATWRCHERLPCHLFHQSICLYQCWQRVNWITKNSYMVLAMKVCNAKMKIIHNAKMIMIPTRCVPFGSGLSALVSIFISYCLKCICVQFFVSLTFILYDSRFKRLNIRLSHVSASCERFYRSCLSIKVRIKTDLRTPQGIHHLKVTFTDTQISCGWCTQA